MADHILNFGIYGALNTPCYCYSFRLFLFLFIARSSLLSAVDIEQAENSRAIANIATSSPYHHSSTNPSGRNPELVEHEDLIGKSLTQDDIIAALQMPDPAKHVLGVVEGSFSQLWKRGDVGFEACFMKSYIFMFENLLRNLPLIQPHIREDAMKVANQWRKRMREDTENPLEVLGFLQFLAVYGLVSSFNEYDISGFLEMISRHKHALELSGSLRVAYEIPGKFFWKICLVSPSVDWFA